MKTTEIKKQESSGTLHFIVVLMLIFFCQAILLTIGAGESKKSINELHELNYLKPSVEKIVVQEAITNPDKTLQKENNITAGYANNEFSIAKLKAYLVAETDQELDINKINSIVFPGEANEKSNAESEIDFQLLEMKAEAMQKTELAVGLYAFEKKIKECLIVEKENPLQLEDWMINSKCWCPEIEEPLSEALFK